MELIGFCAGFFMLGWGIGTIGVLWFTFGFRARGRADLGQPIVGNVKSVDPVVNTDSEFIDGIRQDRFQKGLDPYINTDEA